MTVKLCANARHKIITIELFHLNKIQKWVKLGHTWMHISGKITKKKEIFIHPISNHNFLYKRDDVLIGKETYTSFGS